MPAFSKRSEEILGKSDIRLILIFTKLVRIFDCTILESHRNKDLQDQFFAEGKSKVHWPNSKHNSFPSKAVDVAPYPVVWSNDRKNIMRYYFMAGIVKSIAYDIGASIRWGGDWDSDNLFDDQDFDDLPHFEIRD